MGNSRENISVWTSPSFGLAVSPVRLSLKGKDGLSFVEPRGTGSNPVVSLSRRDKQQLGMDTIFFISQTEIKAIQEIAGNVEIVSNQDDAEEYEDEAAN